MFIGTYKFKFVQLWVLALHIYLIYTLHFILHIQAALYPQLRVILKTNILNYFLFYRKIIIPHFNNDYDVEYNDNNNNRKVVNRSRNAT